jgi:5S rRNA maturation endonuclease (ribonuclease M5)
MNHHKSRINKSQDLKKSGKVLVFDEITNLIRRIQNLAEKGTFIIVEGLNDVRSLNDLGIEDNIIRIFGNERKLIDLERDIPVNGKVIILTDFDREGDRLAKRVETLLEPHKIRFYMKIRGKLRKLLKGRIRTIEGLARYMTKQMEDLAM